MSSNIVKWEITSKCNLKCKHCFLANIKSEDITIHEGKLIVDRLKKVDVTEVIFTSKEPFVYNNFMELLAYCRLQGINISIITN